MSDRAQASSLAAGFVVAAILLIFLLVGPFVYQAVVENISPDEFAAAAKKTTTASVIRVLAVVVIGLLIAALVTIGPVRAASKFSATTVGRVRNIERIHDYTDGCVECDATGDAIWTVATDQTVLFGVPIRTHERITIVDCADCFAEKYPHTAIADTAIDSNQVYQGDSDD